MKINRLLLFLTVVFLIGSHLQMNAQNIMGIVEDESGTPIIGATVKAGMAGTVTGPDGEFNLRVDGLPVQVMVSYLGYETKELQIESSSLVRIQLIASTKLLEDVLVVGSRFAPRTSISSPVPIDNIKADELSATGQVSFDKQLSYTVPSFNSTQQTISDATAHFDPFDLRGLGPSRTLVLINGKRKNPSSLVYINDTPGKGEVGVDMKSIPAAAIERIEVLRDGASAQYGSDAIAGVVNVILKDNYEYTTGNIFGGITQEGDGKFAGYNINTGFKLGRGYLNVTHAFHDQQETNRPGEPGQDFLFGVNDAWTQANPALGMIVGQPNMTSGDFFVNAKLPISNNAEAYGFGGFTYRRGRSYALYRTPYWRPNDFGLHTPAGGTYQGFHPTFDTDIFDNTLAFGVRGEKNKVKYDVSFTNGGNAVDYTVTNSLNTTMGPLSPTIFRVGGYSFKHHVMNMDLARQFGRIQISGGTELRAENFIARAGEEASYIDAMHPEGYGPAGAQSFPGVQPKNEVNAVRYNIGGYLQADVDLTDDLLISGAIRSEKYSDFGSTSAFKLAARYKFWNDRLTVRASYSTGFRAPSLHQIYLSNIQTLISGGTVSEQGTFNNESSVLRRLGVNKLEQEEATNLTAGFAIKPITGLTLSVDFYNIAVDNRIVYSSSIGTSDTASTVYDILQANQITSLKFFLNAVDTRTSGVDIVAHYAYPINSKQKLNISLAANFNKNEIEGSIANPKVLADANIDVFDRKEQSRILTARPNNKIILGLGYEWNNLRINLNNTQFGEVTWQHGSDPTKDQTFAAKLVTDLGISYQFGKFGLGVNVNNLLDVYPDVIDNKGDVVTDLGGRFKYPWEVNQFGFNGRTFSANLQVKF